jgi:hypothetical protein
MNEIDLRGMAPRIRPALPGLGGSNPRGDSIGFTNAYMTFNGKPWLAVSGEIHHARYPHRDWKDELRKMKAGGIDVASTYVFWIHHEEEEGVFDWSGDRDLRLFVQLCAEAGLYVIVRIGPFCHGEVRNGGFPDWLYGRPFAVRSNDGRYLALVRRLYTEIGRRLEGLYFKDGGPIIGVQLENEFMHAAAPWETTPRLCLEWIPGGTGGIAHMRALKKLAREAGIEVPIYTSTGWGGAPVLEGEVLPLYGGYSICPWNITESTPVHSPTREYVFRDFHGEGRRYDVFDPPYDPAAYPFACCEIGGGVQSWYRYRAVAPAESIEAMAVVKLAGGCSLLGYYMFHGGSNPVGARGFLNEHVVPRLSYDFQAPLGEFGQVRESYRRLRRLHLFCRDFADQLLPMSTVLPQGASAIDAKDTDTLRFAARASGDRGFLFFNNYQDHVQTRAHEDAAVELLLTNSRMRIPGSGGFTLKSGVSAIMPFNLDACGVRLEYATCQPIARIETAPPYTVDSRPAPETHFFFFAHEGIPSEYRFDLNGIQAVDSGESGRVQEGESLILRPGAGLESAFSITTLSGARVIVHTLTEKQSLGFSRLRLWGRERAIITQADAHESDGALKLSYRGSPAAPIEILVFPRVDTPLFTDGAPLRAAAEGYFSRYSIAVQTRHVEIEVTRSGPGNAEVRVPAGSFEGEKEILLSIEYEGDVGNAFIDGRLIADDFSNGEPWEIGLRRFRPPIEESGLYIHVTPRREGTLVVHESGMAAQQELRGKQVAEIRSITAIAEREVIVTAAR